MWNNDVKGITAQRVIVGVSQILGVTVVAGQISSTIGYLSGGSLEVGGASLTWGKGWLMGSTTTPQGLLPDLSAGTYYLAATGATVTCQIITKLSAGFENS